MSNVIIKVNPLDPPQIGDRFVITDSRTTNAIDETLVNQRAQSRQTTYNSLFFLQASLLDSAVSADNNTLGIYDITFTGTDGIGGAPSGIKIDAPDGVVFTKTLDNSAGRWDIIITNTAPGTPDLNIDDVTYAEATVEDPCTHVKVIVDTNKLADVVNGPVVINPNTNNPFEFEWVRQTTDIIDCENTADGDQTAQFFTTPDVLSSGNVTINVDESPSGATVTVNVINTSQLTLEYSLDDVVYQSTNVFTGLPIAGYTCYIKDQFGCTITKGFAVTSETPTTDVSEPFEFVSNQNSIRYAKKTPPTTTSGLLELSETYRIEKYESGDDFTNVGATSNETGVEFLTTGQTPTDWTNGSALRKISPASCFDYQNSDTLLSCQEPVNPRVRYTAIQKYNSCDIIKTQFKSNYANINAEIIDENGIVATPPLTQVTNNLSRLDRRDATIINLSGNKTGIYFTSGNTYDFLTGFVNGSYSLNGNLPEFGVVGTYVEIDGFGTHLIEDITISESINARILVFDFIYTGPTTILEVKSVYSVANFEVYEFDVDMSFYLDQKICVSIHMDHPLENFPDVDYISELIDVKKSHTVEPPDQLLEIEYYNTQNGEILYIDEEGNPRIKHKIRSEARSITISSKNNSEILNTDTTSILLNASIYQGDEFVFSPIATEMARRLRNALSHNIVNINGVGYVLEEDIPELERLGESNLYTVTAKMTRTGKIFNTDIQGVGNEVPEVSEVTKLLTGELGFVKTG